MPAKFEKKKFVFNFRSLVFLCLQQARVDPHFLHILWIKYEGKLEWLALPGMGFGATPTPFVIYIYMLRGKLGQANQSSELNSHSQGLLNGGGGGSNGGVS